MSSLQHVTADGKVQHNAHIVRTSGTSNCLLIVACVMGVAVDVLGPIL